MYKKSIAKAAFAKIILIVVLTSNGCSLQPMAWKPPVKPDLTGKLVQRFINTFTY